LREGDILLGYFIGYPLGRFFLEYLRPDAWMLGPIAAAQLFAIICVLAAAAILVVRHTVARAPTPAPEGGGETSATDSSDVGDTPEAEEQL
jgi:phosphatidylglycerol:prolipoprotein diacylglycerol transferase